MKVRDFIDVIRPITAIDPECDIQFSLFMNELYIHCSKGKFECSICAKDVPVNDK